MEDWPLCAQRNGLLLLPLLHLRYIQTARFYITFLLQKHFYGCNSSLVAATIMAASKGGETVKSERALAVIVFFYELRQEQEV